ncbi:MAG: hypothetical protein ACYTFO_04335 [Planctomycetota bacterium]|jgi:hypothetical protein
MPNQTGPFAYVTGFARIALIVTLILAAVSLIGSIAMAVVSLATGGDIHPAQIVLFITGGLMALLMAVWALVAYGMVRVIVANEPQVYSCASPLERLESLLADEAASLRRLQEMSSLSDKAKSLLYREHEMEAFRETIQHALFRQDYHAAQQLIEEIGQVVGYEAEARRLLQEVDDYRNATTEQKVQAAINRVESLITSGDWTRALRETQRLSELFADNAKIAALPRRIHLARTKHKRDLLQAYGEAARKNDVDRSIELLRELDAYLTPQEAAALSESARGVFKARLSNLGVQFAIYVEDEQWAQAIAAGQEIIREFPNSRMAHEVREKLPALQGRASDTHPMPDA